MFASDDNPSICFNYSEISEIIDKHVPFKKISKKDLKFQQKLWIVPAIKVSIDVKNMRYENFLKTKSFYYKTNLYTLGII